MRRAQGETTLGVGGMPPGPLANAIAGRDARLPRGGRCRRRTAAAGNRVGDRAYNGTIVDNGVCGQAAGDNGKEDLLLRPRLERRQEVGRERRRRVAKAAP